MSLAPSLPSVGDGAAAQPLLRWDPLVEGVLRRRYKRFLAEVELPGGELVTVHCANTGPMTGVLLLGGRVRLRHAPAPTRKLDWTWEQAEVPGVDGQPVWVGVNTALPNRLVRQTIESGLLAPWLGPIGAVRAEVPYGEGRRSRIDLLLHPSPEAVDPRPIYVEVKNTTWCQGDVGLFPDTVSERGQKHLRELMGVMPEARAVLVPCLSRPDVRSFAPGDSADPRYGALFREALAAGVEVLPCRYRFEVDAVLWEGVAPVLPQQPTADPALAPSATRGIP
ncbi:MAG: DNA/RNA nuclease SfsA [Cyanobacteriota bacterium]|nr:DNA/RNA nuclease SfsA [Cyanobacteriota bacterium]